MPEKSLSTRASNLPSKPATAGPPAAAGGVRWNIVGPILGAVAILWLTAGISGSKIFIGIVGVLTLAIAGAVVWMLRWANKQREMMELLQGASASPQARKEALAKLGAKAGADKDVMNLIARAQLEAQDDPDKALATLETVDLRKVPGPMADDVRAFRAQLYLVNGRSKEARELADEIKITQAGSSESRGMLAATVAEAWARTGKHKDAMDLLQTIKPEDPDFKSARQHLLFARIYAGFASGRNEEVKRDMNALIQQDMNLIARFMMPKAKVHPQLQKMASEVLKRSPEARKMAQKQQRVQRRPR